MQAIVTGGRGASGSRSRAPSPAAAGASSSMPATVLRSSAGCRARGRHRIAGDVADPDAPPRLVEPRTSRSTSLVNNASVLGPTPLPPLADYPLDELARVYEVNVIAPLALVQLALPLLRRRRGGSSTSARTPRSRPYEGWGGYGSSKAALDQLTAVLGVEKPGPARLRGRPGRHADPDAPGGVPGRGHLRPAAAGGERSRPARADRGRRCRAAATAPRELVRSLAA